VLEIIAHCESGNSNVNTRGGSTASGFLQILDSTWRAFGGTQFASRAINASREEQFIVGQRILAGQGINAWNPSRGCWGGKIGKATTVTNAAPTPKKKVATTPAPTPVKKAKSAPKTIKKPVSTQSISRNAAKSYTIKRGDTLLKIARANNTTWRSLYNANRDTVKNPNLIYTGNHLRLT